MNPLNRKQLRTPTTKGSAHGQQHPQISLPSGTSLRHMRLTVSANTGWPAGQFSEVEAYLTS
ncbi:hypothetical protein [Streptomyces brasiliensis]|uniref:Uncharacterized protein n=1 Tax=Streptomyces brasiliensis TaxID=1954 RepID=A0A917P031_9ACTN|nr:hypothetical protein [Streptomyces brasiliensis]GGJ45450.1 hypothetical protein GCM10010121_065850 [Streptomyces brasiliensis]